MSNKQNPIAKDLRTSKYRKRVVESKKHKLKRQFQELERQLDAEWQQDSKRSKEE